MRHVLFVPRASSPIFRYVNVDKLPEHSVVNYNTVRYNILTIREGLICSAADGVKTEFLDLSSWIVQKFGHNSTSEALVNNCRVD